MKIRYHWRNKRPKKDVGARKHFSLGVFLLSHYSDVSPCQNKSKKVSFMISKVSMQAVNSNINIDIV